jgi:hypothetical protein
MPKVACPACDGVGRTNCIVTVTVRTKDGLFERTETFGPDTPYARMVVCPLCEGEKKIDLDE